MAEIRFLSPQANYWRCLAILREVPERGIVTETINFDQHNGAPIQGKPEDLVKEWGQKFALTFDSQGQIVPVNGGGR